MCMYVCFMFHLRRFKYNNSMEMDASHGQSCMWLWEYKFFPLLQPFCPQCPGVGGTKLSGIIAITRANK